ncbi:hypothetical protein EVC30_079 [Rhizobium phage RHph_Y1_11]|nr:hypothetical protein EVC30_079 [Rhizobium phage RHph_Y1_11]
MAKTYIVPEQRQREFNEHPSSRTAADLLTTATEFWAEGALSDGEYQNIVGNVRDWLNMVDEKTKNMPRRGPVKSRRR